MKPKKEKTYKVRNTRQGGIYVIGENKLKSEPGEWETVIEDEVLPVKKAVTKDDYLKKYTPSKVEK